MSVAFAGELLNSPSFLSTYHVPVTACVMPPTALTVFANDAAVVPTVLLMSFAVPVAAESAGFA